MTWHGGEYHLFFQYVPDRPRWEVGCHWGHATSTDLLTWTEHPVALAPGDGDDGVWSGCLVDGPGGARIWYTAVDADAADIGRVRQASPADDAWLTWVKGPVVAELPDGLEVTAFRDPMVVPVADGWLMLLGAGLVDGTATAVRFRSDDLQAWVPDGVLATRPSADRDPVWTGDAWECPQLFELDGSWVLTVSVWDRVDGPVDEAYAVGDLVDGDFVARTWGRFTYGPACYAGSAFAFADGSRGMIHWLREVADVPSGWAGAQSLPHRLRLVDDRLLSAPPEQLVDRRGAEVALADGGSTALGRATDVVWAAGHDGARLVVRSQDGDGDGRLWELSVDGAVVRLQTGAGSWSMPTLGADLRVVVDGQVLEVFGAGGVLVAPVPAAAASCLSIRGSTARCWPLG